MSFAARVLERTWAYRLWQAPFAERKLAPVLGHNNVRAARRVLDVGCGPGTNVHHFAHGDYVGVDYNRDYIAHARRHYQGHFVVGDVRALALAGHRPFDFILANSLLHHLDAVDAGRVLTQLGGLLTAEGHVHIVDLVLPERRSVARWLARRDRGAFPRRQDEWLELFTTHFRPVVFEPFALMVSGVALWHLVYFKGRARS